MQRTMRYDELHEELKDELIQLEPGNPFRSVRDIMRDHRVSQATVTRAINPLLEEGLLKKQVGRGMFVTKQVLRYKKDTPPTIAFAVPRWTSHSFFIMEEIFIKAQDTRKFHGEIVPFEWQDVLLKKLPPNKIDGLIVLPAGGVITPKHIQRLENFNIPYLILEQGMKDIQVSSVFCDDEFGGAIIADHLIKLKHKSLAVVISEPPTEGISDRVRGFLHYCELQQVHVQVLNCQTQPGQNSVKNAYRKIGEVLRNGKPEFTGIFVDSEQPALGVFKALHEAGLKIPDDISVASLGNSFTSEFFYPGLTTLSSEFDLKINTAIDVIVDKINSADKNKVIKKSIRAHIIERESTGICKTTK